jgi:glucosamine--fructose-6-phosphate aminotransferase (isomerizing)
MNGVFMATEIAEQPAVLQRILQDGWPHIQHVATAIRSREPQFVLFVARGTSDHAALYAKYLVETRLELPAGLVSPSTITVYDAHPRLRNVLLIAVSQSGSSPDVIEPIIRARAGGATTLAITNTSGSPLDEAAEYRLHLLAGPERAVAATKTFTAELLTLFLLVEALAGRSGEEAANLPEQAKAILAREREVAQLALRYRFAEQLVITARGYTYAAAREAALKLMETSYLVAHAFSAADLLHGPMAMIDRGFPVIAIVPKGPGGMALKPVLERLRALGADVLVSGDPAAVSLGTVGLALPHLGPEVLAPLLTILPMQQFAWHLARERGVDPDQPRGLQKVTKTR